MNNRPCSNCPRPGIKKLHNAARTLPAEPWPAMLRSYKRMQDRQVDFAASSPTDTGARRRADIGRRRQDKMSIHHSDPFAKSVFMALEFAGIRRFGNKLRFHNFM